MPDLVRVWRVALKLARGHIDYELNIQLDDTPAVLQVELLMLMSEERRKFFENPEPGPFAPWPETGSRAFVRFATGGNMGPGGWMDVQTGRYRYKVGQVGGTYAHYVLSEYLGCRVVWV